MPDDTFSRIYIRPTAPLGDSVRARRRIGARVQRYDGQLSPTRLAQYLHEETGARVPRSGTHWWNWDEFFQKCESRDLLDAITHLARYIHQMRSPNEAAQWLIDVRRIFAEEHLAYTVDDAGVVHLAVDEEFQKNRLSTIAGLQAARYANVHTAFESVSDLLVQQPPDTKGAWRAVFNANEGLFRLIFPNSPRLTATEVDRQLLPLLENIYRVDAVALRAAQRLLKAFKEWVEASHNYRHEPGVQEPAQAPLELAILAISEGTSFLRWLRELDPQAP
jgi:hypothetical protein